MNTQTSESNPRQYRVTFRLGRKEQTFDCPAADAQDAISKAIALHPAARQVRSFLLYDAAKREAEIAALKGINGLTRRTTPMSTDSLSSGQTSAEAVQRPVAVVHPYCNVCGWRKGGVDSWDGNACKCGHYAPAFEMLVSAPERRQ